MSEYGEIIKEIRDMRNHQSRTISELHVKVEAGQTHTTNKLDAITEKVQEQAVTLARIEERDVVQVKTLKKLDKRITSAEDRQHKTELKAAGISGLISGLIISIRYAVGQYFK